VNLLCSRMSKRAWPRMVNKATFKVTRNRNYLFIYHLDVYNDNITSFLLSVFYLICKNLHI
jgi:hypothetical protein